MATRASVCSIRIYPPDFSHTFLNLVDEAITRQVDLLKVPLFVALAGEDRIGDNRKNEKFFDKIPYPDKTLVTYEDARHILEYSPERKRFFTDLLNWLNEQDEFVHH